MSDRHNRPSRDKNTMHRVYPPFKIAYPTARSRALSQKRNQEQTMRDRRTIGFVSYMPREEENKECKYSFDLEEESSSCTGSSRKQSVWQRKVQKIKEKGPGALDHFRIAEKERLRFLRSNFSEEQKQRIRELQRKRQMEYRKRKAEKRKKAFPGGAIEKKKMEEIARRQKRYDNMRQQGKNQRKKIVKRERHCDYMRQWRENQSAEKRKEYNRKRMVRYYKRKNEHCSTELLEAEKLFEPDQESPAPNSSLGSPCNTPEAKCSTAYEKHSNQGL